MNFEWLFDAVRIRELLDGCSTSRHFVYKGFLQKHYHYNLRELANQILSRLVFNCHFWPNALPCGFLMHCLCFKSQQTSGKLLHVRRINLRYIWAMWEWINAHRMTVTKRVHNAITSVMIFKNQVWIITTRYWCLGQGNVFTPVLSQDAMYVRGGAMKGGSLWPSVMAFCYSLLVWPSVMAFCYGLLVERQSLSREQVSARKDTPLWWKNGWYGSYLNSFLLVCLFYFLSFGLNGITRQKETKSLEMLRPYHYNPRSMPNMSQHNPPTLTSQRYFHSW